MEKQITAPLWASARLADADPQELGWRAGEQRKQETSGRLGAPMKMPMGHHRISSHFTLNSHPGNSYYYCLHFSDEEMEARRD